MRDYQNLFTTDHHSSYYFDLDPYLSGKMTSQQDINALSQPISEDSIFPFRKVFFLNLRLQDQIGKH